MRKSLKSKLGDKKLHLDQRTLAKIEDMEQGGIVVGNTLDLLRSLRSQFEAKGFLTEGQRALVRKIEKDYEDYPLWLQTRNRLMELYSAGQLPPESHTFVESVVAQFDERHTWSVLQMEQIINIIERHDPEEDTDDGSGDDTPQ
jgi:hypothetical protein